MRVLVCAFVAALLCGCPSGLDLERGRHYACERTSDVAEQCPAGWVCTLDGFCQNEAVPGAFRCEAAEDCTGGWHCGPAGVCYDRLDAGSVACRQDLPEDCAPGWRCAFDGVCRNLADQGLRPAPTDAQLQATVESPRYELSATDLAVSGRFQDDVPTEAWALAVDGGVRHLVSRNGGHQRYATFHPVEGVTAIAAHGRDVIANTTTGAILRLTTERDGSTSAQTLESDARVSDVQLRAIRDARPWVFGFSEEKLFLTADGGTFVEAARAEAPLTDFTAITETDGAGASASVGAVGFVAVSAGTVLFTPQWPDGGIPEDGSPEPPFRWMQLAVPGVRSCGQIGLEPTLVAGKALSPLAGADAEWSLAVAGIHKGMGRWAVVLAVKPEEPLDECKPLHEGFSPMEACGAADEIPTLVRVGANNWGEVLTRCRAPDGTERTYLVHDPGGYVFLPRIDELPETPAGLSTGPALPARSATHLFAFHEQNGRISTCVRGEGHQTVCQRPVLGHPPRYLTALSDGGAALLASPLGDDAPPVTHFDSPMGYAQAVGAAVQASSPCGVISGMPEAYLRCEASGVKVYRLGGAEPLGDLLGSSTVFPDVAFKQDLPAVAWPAGDGGTAVVVGAYDALWAGEVPPSLDAGVGRLQPRLSPAPRGRITSLAVAPALEGEGHARGFLIAQERVFAISAASETQWRAEEVPLPAGRPVEVWMDGLRGRAAYADGRVFAIPSGVQLAPSLPGMADVESSCGQGYALTPEGLFLLDEAPDGALPGRWRPVPLPALPQAAADWSGGRLLAGPGGLLAVTRYGLVVRVADTTCP